MISHMCYKSHSNAGWRCIPEHGGQKVTWVGEDYDSLLVHSGYNGLKRVPASHVQMRDTYWIIVRKLRNDIRSLGIKVLMYEEFVTLQDSSSSFHAGEGLDRFNNTKSTTELFCQGKSREFKLEFMRKASNMYKLVLAAIHVCGGPSPRGTEDAVTRLSNSHTELVRNVQKVDNTIGVQNGCVTSAALTDTPFRR